MGCLWSYRYRFYSASIENGMECIIQCTGIHGRHRHAGDAGWIGCSRNSLRPLWTAKDVNMDHDLPGDDVYPVCWCVEAVLLILRFFTGMGLGAVLPTGGTLVSEFSPTRLRGTLLVLLNGFWGLGGTLAALVGYFLVLHTGWRPAMIFGGLAIISGLLIHWLLPESLRFLLSKGMIEKAQKEYGVE